MLTALRLWSRKLASHAAAFHVRGDSVVALSVAVKLASSSPMLNSIGAELALELELADITETITAHIPGKLNVTADWLS